MKSKKHNVSAIVFYTVIIALGLVLTNMAFAGLLPDTGQTQSYTNTFGEDSDYTCNPHSYTDLGNGIVRDNVTGLEWQQATAPGTYTWQQAIDYCNNLSLGGKDDWRLPTVKELSTLVDSSIPAPGPTINTSYFPDTVASYYYWSSTTLAISIDTAWGVYFGYGFVVYLSKSDYLYVRAVRGGQSNNSFIDNGNGTVTDTSTGLMWQQATAPGAYTWVQALTYCENLTLGGYSDWRLPNRNELQSIVDYSRYNPAIDTTYFPGPVASLYWSSTTDASYTVSPWSVAFPDGSVDSYGCKYDCTNYVRAVRGGQCVYGDFTYTESGGTITITKYTGTGGNVVIPDAIDGKPVVGIAQEAFNGCTSLTSVTIPNSVTSIRMGSFSGCSGLTSVTIGNSVTIIGSEAFANCTGLTSVTFPDSVTVIGWRAFANCTGLTSVTLGKGVAFINPEAGQNASERSFSGCSSLTSIVVDINNTVFSSQDGVLYNKAKTVLIQYPEAKSGGFIIPDSVTSINTNAFYSCAGLTSVIIPDNVTSIGWGAFYHCSSLTSVTIPDRVTGIGGETFNSCTSLTIVTIPDSVTSIGLGAFAGCSSLTSVTIPDRVTGIDSYAFHSCSGLTSVTIPNNVTSIGEMSFYNCTGLTSAYFLGNAPSMGPYVFYKCASTFTVCYTAGSTGFTTPTWYGYPTELCAIRTLVREYYLDILDREPDQGGWDYWTNEIKRIMSLGIYVGEGFQAEARLFFTCQEYKDKGKSDNAFVTDLYQTFLQREPDAAGLAYWVGQLNQGLTRNMLITTFAYCDEFKAYMTTQFGADTTRPENNMLNDLYRGFLNRFPDNDGYNSWLVLMREAQCTGANTLRDLCHAIALSFVESNEYILQNSNNAEYTEDLYNAILRRGADPGGFLSWVDALNNGLSRPQTLQFFTDSTEFQGRVDAVIAAGCLP